MSLWFDLNEIHVRIGGVVHKADIVEWGMYTLCDIRWVREGVTELIFPRGTPTKDSIDCMTCLVKEANQ